MLHSVEHPLYPLLARIKARDKLDEADCWAFLSLRARIKVFRSGVEFVAQGDSADDFIVLINGFVSQSRTTGSDQKQITSFHIKGDVLGLQSFLTDVAESSIETRTPSTIAFVSKLEIFDLAHRHPNIMRALWRESLLEAALLREWTLSLGKRSARERLAHLLLELEVRSRTRALCRDAFELPIKQGSLASALGLSVVHLNKSLQWLRREGFLTVTGRLYEISKRDDLASFCGFDPAYLDLRPVGKQFVQTNAYARAG